MHNLNNDSKNKQGESILIGSQIYFYRNLKGLTQKELSDKSGISKVYITNIETGKKIPSFKSILKIANALEIDWKDLTISPVLNKIDSLEINESDKNLLKGLFTDLGQLI